MPLRLEELANVIDSVEDNKTIAWNNGTRGIILAISRQPGTNTVEIVDNIRALLPELQAALPPSVELLICSTMPRRPFAHRFTTWSSRWF